MAIKFFAVHDKLVHVKVRGMHSLGGKVDLSLCSACVPNVWHLSMSSVILYMGTKWRLQSDGLSLQHEKRTKHADYAAFKWAFNISRQSDLILTKFVSEQLRPLLLTWMERASGIVICDSGMIFNWNTLRIGILAKYIPLKSSFSFIFWNG